MGEELKEKLFNKRKNGWEKTTPEQKQEIFNLSKNIWTF